MIVLPELLQAPRPVINVRPPKYKEVPKLARAFFDAFDTNPTVRYVSNNKKSNFLGNCVRRFRTRLHIIIFMRTKIFLTVEGGVAGVIAIPPQRVSSSPDALTTLSRLLLKLVSWKGRYEDERIEEFDDKVNEVVKIAIGDRVKEMWYIDGLFTAPSSQGQGNGGALLDAVTKQADESCRATWLKSSDPTSAAFYNSHGFTEVTAVILGDQNPTWDGPPVIISIMLREPGINGDGISEKGI